MATPISAWADLMTDTIIHEPLTGRDAYGAPTYGPPVSYKCRIVVRQSRVRGVAGVGQELLSSHQVWLAQVLIPNYDDRFTLPDGTQPLLLTRETPHDENGAHHTKLQFGGTSLGSARG